MSHAHVVQKWSWQQTASFTQAVLPLGHIGDQQNRESQQGSSHSIDANGASKDPQAYNDCKGPAVIFSPERGAPAFPAPSWPAWEHQECPSSLHKLHDDILTWEKEKKGPDTVPEKVQMLTTEQRAKQGKTSSKTSTVRCVCTLCIHVQSSQPVDGQKGYQIIVY